MAFGSITNLEAISHTTPRRAVIINVPSASASDIGDRIQIRPGDTRVLSVGYQNEGDYQTIRFACSQGGGPDFANWLRTQIDQWFYLQYTDSVGSVSSSTAQLHVVLDEFSDMWLDINYYIVTARFIPSFTTFQTDLRRDDLKKLCYV